MAVGLKKGHAYAQIEKKSLIMAGTHSFFPQKPSAHWQNFFAWPSGGRGNWDLNCPWMQTPCLLMQGICTLQLPTCEGAHGCEQVSSPKATIGRMFEWCLSAAVVKPSLKPMTPWKITKASCQLPRICHAFATSLGRLERYVGFGWSGRGNSSSREVPPRRNYNTWRHVFPYADADDAGSARVKPHYVTTVVKNMWNVDECCGCTCHVGMREHWLRWQECSFTFFHHFVNPDGRRCLLLMGISQNSPHQTGCAGWIISWISPF